MGKERKVTRNKMKERKNMGKERKVTRNKKKERKKGYKK